ncbi:OprO/OprP family phosphate-selective porin [Stieleria sp. JC731]|uniref:porin n=1 Tax=Pirellulaceae TaxID=2691357 RepID=UPI001E59F91B|nr:porin [Stieleria sp. JC731]MCC9600279.1 OprO/OprP family phosphate-selective porin [Stieleria sp. JC731]
MNVKTLRVLFTLAALGFTQASDARGQETFQSPSLIRLQQQVDAQAFEIDQLKQLLNEQQTATSLPFGIFPDDSDTDCTPGSIARIPLVIQQPVEVDCDGLLESGPSHQTIDFYSDFNKGFTIVPFDKQAHPFQLKICSWIQFRHHDFEQDITSWTDQSGTTRSVRHRNVFDIERARLVFKGYAVDERLTYFLQLDGDTDGSHTVDFMDYWWGWQLTENFRIQMGKRKVPGSRQWIMSARRTRFADRPMANDFFRPDRTVGIFGIGTIGERCQYQLMAGDGYRNANVPNSRSDDRFAFAASSYIDPWGDFGGQLVDFDHSCTPLVRIGHSFVYSKQTSDQRGVPLSEADFVRLSDGTRLTQTGAIGPGATVSNYDIYMYGIDAAIKYMGWSFDSEIYMRWIESLTADQPLPQSSLEQHGFYVEGGRFLIPKRLDANLRYSQVSGMFGNGLEYAVGFNWYPLSVPQVKVTFDITELDSSPLQSTPSDILVGDDGTLFRTQFQAEY